MEAIDVGLTAVYFYPSRTTPPTGLSAMLTHLQLQPTQSHVWHGRNCYLDWSQQEGFSQLRLTLFGGKHLSAWQVQWQQLANHHHQMDCMAKTLVYWTVSDVREGWQPFVPTRFSFAEPFLVPRPETAVYLCQQSSGQQTYVAFTAEETTMHRQLIYNQIFWDLEHLWHQAKQAKQAWLAAIDPDLLDYLIQVENAIDEMLAEGSWENRQRLTAVYRQFSQQLHRVTQAERLVQQRQSRYKKKLWSWTTSPPLALLPEIESPISAVSLINVHQQVTLCQQVRYHWWQAILDTLKISWRKRWKTMTFPSLSLN